MNALHLLPFAALVAAIPGAALAQSTAAPAAEAVTRASISARLDADYADLDSDTDGKASRAEIEKRIADETAEDLATVTKRRDEAFKKIDANGDGQISKSEYEAGVPLPKVPPVDAAPMLARFDSDKDGAVSVAEFRAPTLTIFDKMDTNKDGTLSPAEQQAAPSR